MKTTILKTVTGASIVPVFLIPFLMATSCDKKKRESFKTQDSVSQQATKPQIDIKVNRKYDDKGNLIEFDSIYASFGAEKSQHGLADSLIRQFEHTYMEQHTSQFYKNFSPLFKTDSAFREDFFHDDFFQKRYELNDAYIRKMMRDMDSIKNEFYKQRKPLEKS